MNLIGNNIKMWVVQTSEFNVMVYPIKPNDDKVYDLP